MKTITIEIDDKGNIQKIKTLSYWFDIEKYLLSEIHKEFLYNLSILADLYKETFCELTHIDTKSISKETLTSIFYLLSNPKEQTKSLMYNFLFTYPDISQTDESKMCLTKTPIYITSRDFINNVYAVKPHCSAKEFDQLCEQYKTALFFVMVFLKKETHLLLFFILFVLKIYYNFNKNKHQRNIQNQTSNILKNSWKIVTINLIFIK